MAGLLQVVENKSKPSILRWGFEEEEIQEEETTSKVKELLIHSCETRL
jgi:hypothetical protein